MRIKSSSYPKVKFCTVGRTNRTIVSLLYELSEQNVLGITWVYTESSFEAPSPWIWTDYPRP